MFVKFKFFLQLEENSAIKKKFESYSNKQAYILKYVHSKSSISIVKISKIKENGKISHLINSGIDSKEVSNFKFRYS